MEQKQEHKPHCPPLEADAEGHNLYSVYGTHVATIYGVTTEDRASKCAFIKNAVNSHATHLSTIEAQAETIEALQNGVERERAALEGSARLAAEAGRVDLGVMLLRYANNLRIVLNASRSALALAQTEKADVENR
jgi:hypothetical protein